VSGSVTTRVAILDDGVARPTIDATRLFISKLTRGPAGALFGYDGQSSAYTFASYAVSANGVSLLFSQEGLMGVFQNDIHYHEGRVYADWGEVVDVADPAHPFRAGKFAFHGVIAARSSKRLLMLTDGPWLGTMQLRILDPETFTQVSSLSLGTGWSNSFSAGSLVSLGGDGVAFLADIGGGSPSLYLFRSPELAALP
jgi:hypothetical protein